MSSQDFPAAEDEFLDALAADPVRCWPEFLRRYTTTIRRLIARHFRDEDFRMDAYLFVCEKLADHQCEGLRRYAAQPPEKRGRITTWLGIVVRNRCVDWVRSERGRRALPESVARLSAVEQSVFRRVYWYGDSYPATVEHLAGEGYPGLTVGAVAEIVDRIHAALPRTSRWSALLEGLKGREEISLDADFGEDMPPSDLLAGPKALEPDTRFEQESIYLKVRETMKRLDANDQLILLLRFEQELRFRAIAQIMGLESEAEARRRCGAALLRLRRELGLGLDGDEGPEVSFA